MSRELIEAATITRLASVSVVALTADDVNAAGFHFPAVYAEVRVSPTERGLRKGSATSSAAGWRLEVDVIGKLAVNVNRYLDSCQAGLYGHRFTIGGRISTPLQEGTFDPAEPTDDKRFRAFGDWTFVL